jgi:hypothetical protein
MSALKEAEKIFPLVLVPSPLDRLDIDPISVDVAKRKNLGWANLRMAGNSIVGKIKG